MKSYKNISIPGGGNLVVSNLNTYNREGLSENPSVKMVLSGVENYNVDRHSYQLKKDHFLVVDDNNEVNITIDSKSIVTGICVFPEKQLLNEVFKTRLTCTSESLLLPFESQDVKISHNRYNYQENRTGKFLQQNKSALLKIKEDNIIDWEQFFHALAECMVIDQLELEGKLKSIPSTKKSTKEELYRRVYVAKDFIDTNFTQKINLEELSQIALLSKYHFSRTFKSLFGLSPYQYLLQLRLRKAAEYLALNYSYEETSNLIGFSDGKNLRKVLISKTNSKIV